jgi:hypothetical protein
VASTTSLVEARASRAWITCTVSIRAGAARRIAWFTGCSGAYLEKISARRSSTVVTSRLGRPSCRSRSALRQDLGAVGRPRQQGRWQARCPGPRPSELDHQAIITRRSAASAHVCYGGHREAPRPGALRLDHPRNWHYAARRARVIEDHAHSSAVSVDAAGAPQPAVNR